MKKEIFIYISSILLVIILSVFLTSSYRNDSEPKTVYKVYLDGDEIGIIESKKEFEDYIDNMNEQYKEKFSTDRVFSPNGLDLEKVLTYKGKIDSISTVYNIIQKKKPFTISGYQFSVDNTKTEEKKDDKKTEKVDNKKYKLYVTETKVFDEAVESLIKTYAGTEEYQMYLDGTQEEITTTGTHIDNIYLKDNITIKKVNIPVNEKIYSDSIELSQYLLFGNNTKKSKYKVKNGDTIETVAYNNKISTEEFLISNPSFSSANSLLFPGQEVLIGITDPQLQVVIEQSVVKDVVNKYKIIERYDASASVGMDKVIQNGENGLERVSQKVEVTNGTITYVKPISKVELKPTTSKIVVYGQKQVSGVGSTKNWAWPTNSGYTISSNYGWRIDPFTRRRNLHYGLDISGTGHGSPVYAANNGTIVTATRHYSYGNYIVINHNNGYYTLYAHMSRFEDGIRPGVNVSKGQKIGRVGKTGSATGPHLHFEAYVGGEPWKGGTRISPWTLYN